MLENLTNCDGRDNECKGRLIELVRNRKCRAYNMCVAAALCYVSDSWCKFSYPRILQLLSFEMEMGICMTAHNTRAMFG